MDKTAAVAQKRSATGADTAVVVIHGMGEKRPMETLDGFVRTAFGPRDKWHHHPQPAAITDNYEARRYVTKPTEPGLGQADVYEYHWSYLMTANRFVGAMPMTLRLLLRRPSNVPDALFGIWRTVWIVLLVLLLTLPALFVTGYALNTDVPAWIIGLTISGIVLIFWFGLYRAAAKALVNKTTAPFVDVIRYLDPSTYSYAARRAIRGGLVDLLHALNGRYSRIVVVGHSVGAFIAYDALAQLWSETPTDDAENRWRVTDFVTVGAPMALADFLVTRPALFSGLSKTDREHRRELFDTLIARGVLVCCPPRTGALPADSGGEVLGGHSVFAVTRWTNLWFPVVRGEMRGDWFGGALGPLYGPGIRDIEVLGNAPERFKRGSAHIEYFNHPERGDEGDVAWHIRRTLALRDGSAVGVSGT